MNSSEFSCNPLKPLDLKSPYFFILNYTEEGPLKSTETHWNLSVNTIEARVEFLLAVLKSPETFRNALKHRIETPGVFFKLYWSPPWLPGGLLQVLTTHGGAR